MSDSRQHNASKTASRISKYLSTTDTENKIELIDSSERSELIDKLSEKTGHFNRELNNNSISPVSTGEGSGLFSALKMDSKRKSPNESKQSISTLSVIETNGATKLSSSEQTPKQQIQQQQEEPVLQIPSYSSIFAPSSYSKNTSPVQQQHQHQQQYSYRQVPLKADSINYHDRDDNQASSVSTNRFSGRKFLKCNDNLEVGDDLDEEDIDEKMPFNNQTKYRSSNRRISPGESRRCRSPGNKNPMFPFDHRCDSDRQQLNANQQSPHTKISIHDSRLPAVSSCQAGYNQHDDTFANRKIYFPEHPLCYRCDCTDCHKKLKLASAMIDGGSNQSPESYSKSHSRTKSMHLVLKSIILVLLTLLLLMLFVGIILASHYLPQVFDRVLNASRSFNVTIAG